jgi:hypothetical protein
VFSETCSRFRGGRNPGRGKLPVRTPNQPDRMDLQGISGRLRKLSPQQEKVIRLYFGLGCERPHSAREIAQEFGVSSQVIAGILGAAQRRLAPEGLTFSHLREAARGEAELRHSPRPSMESTSEFRRARHWHRRF